MASPKITILVFAAVWLAVKIGFMYSGYSENGFHAGVLINMFFIILIIFWSMRSKKKNETQDPGFLDDFKHVMRHASLYCILVTIGIYAYYNFIDPGFAQGLHDQQMAALLESIPDDESYQQLVEEDPMLRGTTREEYIKRNSEGMSTIYSPGLMTAFSFIALVMVSLLYSILVVVLQRKLLPRT